ncbi:rRNA processing [Macleaya cordata]|uniref:rRNA processing n=1 Tax=Macleaya cordata TaxID=56857 RepID=A0A200QX58_MACCD|nr:rRNA processing [Macleaya cordata]
MKNRTSQDDKYENRKKKINGSNSTVMKKTNKKKRLGGGGLSLEAFANAKTKNDNYNPAIIKKQREFYKNAKCVNKYRRSQKQQNGQQIHLPMDTTKLPQDSEEAGKVRKMSKKQNKNNSQSLREVYEKKREEEEKARMEKEATLKAKQEERKLVESQRKERREKMYKKTRSGQPVMKYRIEHLLQTLQGSAK